MTQLYWHREMPPLREYIKGDYQLEAKSQTTPYSFAERDDLWGRCYTSLMAEAKRRLLQEVERLGGSSAHVIDEAIEPVIDNHNNLYSLSGVFTFVLYGAPETKA